MNTTPKLRFPLLSFAFLAWALSTVTGSEPKAKAKATTRPSTVDATLRATTITGQELRPFFCDGQSIKAAVLVFVTTDCPVANRYAPELERIRADVAKAGVTLTLVHVDPDLTEKAARDHAAEYSLKAPVVIDRTHQLVAATGARVTPEAVVIDATGRIRYRGRINDQFTDFGAQRKAPSTHDLRDALRAVLEGREVAHPETTPVGCLIPKQN
jgi:hypothetical protein